MKPLHHWARIGALALTLGTGAAADTPLHPPADYARTTDGVSVSGSVSRHITTIGIESTGQIWTIPGWQRYIYPSPDGSAMLTMPEGGNLIYGDDPDQIILTLHRPDAEPIEARLGQLMDPDNLVETVSHYNWFGELRWTSGGWTLEMIDASTYFVSAETGEFVRK